MAGNKQHEQGNQPDAFPMWQPTEWTRRQHAAALSALVLLGGSCALIAWAFAQWGDGPNALNTVVPIGMSIYCLGTSLLAYVFCFAYRHGANSSGANANTARAFYGMLLLEAIVAFVSLTIESVGATSTAWRIYSFVVFLLQMALCAFFAVLISFGAALLSWKPTRDPSSPVTQVNAPVRGLRRFVRWLVALMASASWALIAGPLYVLFSLWGSLNVDSETAPAWIAHPAPLFVVVAVLFLALAAVEGVTPPSAARADDEEDEQAGHA